MLVLARPTSPSILYVSTIYVLFSFLQAAVATVLQLSLHTLCNGELLSSCGTVLLCVIAFYGFSGQLPAGLLHMAHG